MLSCSKVTFIFVNMSSADATLKQYKKKSCQMAVTMTHEEDEEMYKTEVLSWVCLRVHWILDNI